MKKILLLLLTLYTPLQAMTKNGQNQKGRYKLVIGVTDYYQGYEYLNKYIQYVKYNRRGTYIPAFVIYIELTSIQAAQYKINQNTKSLCVELDKNKQLYKKYENRPGANSPGMQATEYRPLYTGHCPMCKR